MLSGEVKPDSFFPKIRCVVCEEEEEEEGAGCCELN